MNALNCSFVNNSAGNAGSGGAYYAFAGGTVNFENSLFKNNLAGGSLNNCSGVSGVSQGNNLSDGVSADCNLGGTDFSNTVARLGPLQSNGGPTQTMALLPNSPGGMGQANTGACPATDQRGFLRLTDGKCDIGAFEAQ